VPAVMWLEQLDAPCPLTISCLNQAPGAACYSPRLLARDPRSAQVSLFIPGQSLIVFEEFPALVFSSSSVRIVRYFCGFRSGRMTSVKLKLCISALVHFA
jgi:hypothetical protein